MASEDPRTPAITISNSLVCLVILAYCIISLGIVFFNFWLFTSKFEFPLFVSWIQQIVGVVIFATFAGLGSILKISSPFVFARLSFKTFLRVLPLSMTFVLMVAFSNHCLKNVHVSTYQVARSLTILFTILFTFGLLGETHSRGSLLSCAVMFTGFVIGSLDTSTIGLVGFISGACSSVFQALYNVFIKKTLIHVDNNTCVLLLYNQIISSFLFIPIIYIGDEGGALDRLPLKLTDSAFYEIWFSLIFSGVLAAFMNLAAYLCVKMTSPLSFNIAGFAKSILQSVGGFVFFGDVLTFQILSGILLSLAGTTSYGWVKVNENATKTRSIRNEMAQADASEIVRL